MYENVIDPKTVLDTFTSSPKLRWRLLKQSAFGQPLIRDKGTRKLENEL